MRETKELTYRGQLDTEFYNKFLRDSKKSEFKLHN